MVEPVKTTKRSCKITLKNILNLRRKDGGYCKPNDMIGRKKVRGQKIRTRVRMGEEVYLRILWSVDTWSNPCASAYRPFPLSLAWSDEVQKQVKIFVLYR